jgi:hypothetical protein
MDPRYKITGLRVKGEPGERGAALVLMSWLPSGVPA